MRVLTMSAALVGVALLAATAGAADPELGKQVWAKKCASCHGADGKGDAKMAERLKAPIPDLTKAANADFVAIITAGKKPMPAFGKSLSTEELDAVAHYARSLAGK